VLGDADHRQRLIRRGQENIRRFSSEAIAASYRNIYQSVLELAPR
jgi:hypothetical protein